MNETNKNGKIGVTSENIFPIIKKFLYSEHDIFLRELVSNAVDATTKLQTITAKGEHKEELGDLSIRVALDKENKTLTITDRGIGMTADEIERYINQIAFSGAEDFLKKYEGSEASIIGHFGLGFYSAFMVAHRVEIDTLSYKPESKAVHWSCNGSPEYTLSDSNRTDRGTTITLHIDEDSEQFLEKSAISALLHKYCGYLPVPIIFGKKEEWKDGKMQETDEDLVINDTKPLWMQNPKDVTEEAYKSFHQKLYPNSNDALFHIHLNVDYPFTLKGILYFPQIKETVDPLRNHIQLYCNQVFVTDQVEDIVPNWLTLLEGVIDSPDIPLNVSRSYLQQDANAKKITNHIGKKVADALLELFRSDRKGYEDKWSSLGTFVQYGMLSEEKTYERLKPCALFTDVDGKAYTIEEYRALIGSNQTNKEEQLVVLYTTNKEEQYVAIERAKEKGYNVLLMDGPLSIAFLNMLEEKEEKIHFTRVDSDTIERLIIKESSNNNASNVTEQGNALLSALFDAAAPKDKSKMYRVETDGCSSENAVPAEIVSNEWMRRMKDMSRFQPGMSFYDSLPDSYTLRINTCSPLIKDILTQAEAACGENFNKLYNDKKQAQEEREKLVASFEGKPESDLSDEQKEQRKSLTDKIEKCEQEMQASVQQYAKDNIFVNHVWDLALIARNLMSGERLTSFLKRSESLLTQHKAE